jgi:hypothetical protein
MIRGPVAHVLAGTESEVEHCIPLKLCHAGIVSMADGGRNGGRNEHGRPPRRSHEAASPNGRPDGYPRRREKQSVQ